jgi:hypothetical protein
MTADTNETPKNLPATQQSRELVSAEDHDFLMGQEATDDFTAGDIVLPWLTLVQGTSGYVKRNDPNYIPEAREGDITDSLTKRLRATQSVILCRYEIQYTTWQPNGGRIVKQWFTDPTGYNAARFPEGKNYGKKIDADNNEVRPQAVYYILAVDRETGVFMPMVWGLGSTQFGKAKKINSLAREMIHGPKGPYVPPIYGRIFDLSSVGEQGEVMGQMKYWSGWVANPGESVLQSKYGRLWAQAAVEFRKQILSGQVRPAAPEGTGTVDENEGHPEASYTEVGPDERDQQGGRYATKRTDDADIPF